MRIREPRTTALIFSSGKMVCTGAKRLGKFISRIKYIKCSNWWCVSWPIVVGCLRAAWHWIEWFVVMLISHSLTLTSHLNKILFISCQWGAVSPCCKEVCPGGTEAWLPSQISWLQNPEHGWQLWCMFPHTVGGPGSDSPTVQQVWPNNWSCFKVI